MAPSSSSEETVRKVKPDDRDISDQAKCHADHPALRSQKGFANSYIAVFDLEYGNPPECLNQSRNVSRSRERRTNNTSKLDTTHYLTLTSSEEAASLDRPNRCLPSSCNRTDCWSCCSESDSTKHRHRQDRQGRESDADHLSRRPEARSIASARSTRTIFQPACRLEKPRRIFSRTL